jgi:hypothetical protein
MSWIGLDDDRLLLEKIKWYDQSGLYVFFLRQIKWILRIEHETFNTN